MLSKDYKRAGSRIQIHSRGSVRLKVVFFSLLILVSLVFTQLVFANNLATDGEKLSHIQEEINKLERENMSLKAEIANVSALSRLSEKANKNGFTKPKSVTILNKL